ncbi:MAG: TIGR03936 family radical SAM-associated protein [Bacillota bacterium]
MLYRIKFSKLEDVMYISHLQVIKTLRRIVRRAKLPAAFSGGFNPQISLSVGPPLAVGIISRGEYFDLELTEERKVDEVVARLNNASPGALRFLKAVEIDDGAKSLSSILDTAVYTIKFNFTDDFDLEKQKEMLDEFLSEDKIIVVRKRRKKADREVDLKGKIFSAEVVEKDLWKFAVVTGSRGNVRPEEINRALMKKYSTVNKITPLDVMREGVFVNKNNKFYEPYSDSIVRS